MGKVFFLWVELARFSQLNSFKKISPNISTILLGTDGFQITQCQITFSREKFLC
jgi:hypothetical protein